MHKIIVKLVFLMSLALATPYTLAEDVAPDVLLNAVTLEVIAIIRQDKDVQAGSPSKVADLVETRILPLFDFAGLA